ncbi:MAG: methyltransferase domain-containing protein [Chthoniobacterales bacterium]
MHWPLTGFDLLARIDRRRRHRRFPIRFLRYWFCRHALAELHARLGRPLNVLEVGIADGRMLGFLGGPPNQSGDFSRPDWIGRWDGLDLGMPPEAVRRYSYSGYIQANVEAPFPCERRYDAIVLLHVLEHLFEPDATMTRLAGLLNDGGLLLGGSPTMPARLARFWERLLRFRNGHRDATIHRHVSVISPDRLIHFAQQNGMKVQLLTGAFLCRWTGIFLENTERWLRANLSWGARFPSLGGEIYFCLRKEASKPAPAITALPIPCRAFHPVHPVLS